MALPVERSVLSTEIIDIVRKTDLNSLTSKYVRTQLEKKLNVKLVDFRKEIDSIIRDSIEKLQTDQLAKATNGTASNNNSTKIEPKSESKTTPPNSINKASKREPSSPPKSDTPISLSDFAFDEDNDKFSAIKRRRAATQRTAVQRKPAAKRAKKSNEGGGTKKKTAFTRICVLSDELSDILNKKYMRRSDVVKRMWEYFREKNLMDPKDKRFVIFDEPMRAVFGVRRIQAFGMMKVLKNHIKDLEFLDEDTRRTAMHEIELLEENGELDRGNISSVSTSKMTVEDSTSSDSSSDSDDQVEQKPPNPPKPINNNHAISASPSTSKTEEPRAAKLVLRISKKNDRVVSVKVNDDEEQSKNARPPNDNGSTQNVSSNASTADMEGPPQLDLEVTNDPASSSPDSSSGSSSSDSSSGSSSSSASSSPEHPAQNNVGRRNLNDDLQLSESDSDA